MINRLELHTTMTHTERSHSSTSGGNSDITLRISEYNHLELQTFQYTDHNTQDMEYDIDPDNNFYSSINNNCSYCTDELYNQIDKDGKLSIIHINSRSLYANVTNIKDYL